ncbi:MAG: hypothetical protein GY765_34520, partial [bacterium]|nr:hypothetical protein [bacterium]
MCFKKFLTLEVQRILSRRYLAVLIVFFVVMIVFLQSGINRYQKVLREKDHFANHERTTIDRVLYTPQYGYYGIRVLFVPSPMVALWDAGPLPPQITAFFDSSERVRIYKSLKGQNAFSRMESPFMNFAGFVLLFVPILSLLYGLDGFRRHRWLRFLQNISGDRKKLFLFILTSRTIVPAALCLFMAALTIVMFFLNRLPINVGQILIYF